LTEGRHGTTGKSISTKNRRVPTPGTLRYRLLQNGTRALGGLGLDQEVNVLRHQNPADQQEALFLSELAQNIHKHAAEAGTVKDLQAAVNTEMINCDWPGAK